ncbi:MAG: Ig-like domain-containing protein, partial [Vibrio fluvialis]
DLTFVLVDGPAHGQVTLNADGTYAYTADATYTGSDVFRYRSVDADGLTSAVAEVSLTLAPQAFSAGEEFQVNTYTSNEQVRPSVATFADGGYVIVWQSNGQDGNNWGVFGQHYDASGAAVGGEFQVNTYSYSSQANPIVTTLAGGGYVVVWHSYGQDGSKHGIYGQRYDATGVAAGSEFRVNTRTSNEQHTPFVTALADGGYVVVWQSDRQDGSGYGIYGQRYDATGVAAGSEFRVNTYTISSQVNAAVTAFGDGGFVIVWQSNGQEGRSQGVYGQRYDAAGAAVGSEFQVNTHISDLQVKPAIAALSNGGFVVVWQSNGQDSSGYGIYGQRYDAAGAVDGSEFQVNTYTSGEQGDPAVSALADGGFMVVWQSSGEDGSGYGIYGQRYDVSGVAVGDEFLINTYTSGDQQYAEVTVLADGRFVVAWASAGQDGSGNGVYSKVYDFAPMSVTGTASNDVLVGGLADDILDGGAGADRLDGGSGDDWLIGGDTTSADTFVFKTGYGHDTIADFTPQAGMPSGQPGVDVIEIGVTGVQSVANALDLAAQVDADVVLTFGADTLTLKNVQLSDLGADNFQFAS